LSTYPTGRDGRGQRVAPGYLTPDDLARASDLLRQTLVHDHLTPAGVRHLLFDDPGFDPALTRTVEDGGRLVGIAVGPIPFYARVVGAQMGRVYYQYARSL
jgi:hypothetical protein